MDEDVHGFALGFHFVEAGFHVLIFGVEGLDAGFGRFGFVEVFVDSGGLRFAEADEVDDVGEDLDEAIMRGFQEVVEGEIGDAALFSSHQ